MHKTTVLEVPPEEVKNRKILFRLGPVQLYVFKKQGGPIGPLQWGRGLTVCNNSVMT
jgi:hypothetical protein